MVKLSRRHFFGYASHSMLAAALWRTFLTTTAFGAVGRKKILILTTPNGHHNPMDTSTALLSSLDPAARAQALILNGLNNAVTQSGQDWHGGESALLSFAMNKERGPSFFTSLGLPNTDVRYLAVDVADRHYAIDSGRQPIKPFEDPALAMQSIFGMSLRDSSRMNMALVQDGRKHVLDSCLEDIKKLRSMLGEDRHIFDDYLNQLQEQYKTLVVTPDSPGGTGTAPGAGTGAPAGRFEAPGCNKKAVIAAGTTPETKHQAMLDVAYQLMACDAAQVIVMSYLNNNTDPQHNFIHAQGSNDGGAAFKRFTNDAQTRISKLVSRLAEGGANNLLDNSAVVYISEGGAHAASPTGPFNSGHPVANIPCAVFGRLGGAITKTGTFDATGKTNRNLWRQLADGLAANGKADLTAIGGSGIEPIGI